MIDEGSLDIASALASLARLVWRMSRAPPCAQKYCSVQLNPTYFPTAYGFNAEEQCSPDASRAASARSSMPPSGNPS